MTTVTTATTAVISLPGRIPLQVRAPYRGTIVNSQQVPAIESVPDLLRRIADLIETSTALAPLTTVVATLGLESATELSPRQWEIVRRLVEGERVPTIAEAMFLSRSTVRNHLSAIFSKVGVHSQRELIELYRRRAVSPGHADVDNPS